VTCLATPGAFSRVIRASHGSKLEKISLVANECNALGTEPRASGDHRSTTERFGVRGYGMAARPGREDVSRRSSVPTLHLAPRMADNRSRLFGPVYRHCLHLWLVYGLALADIAMPAANSRLTAKKA